MNYAFASTWHLFHVGLFTTFTLEIVHLFPTISGN